MTYREHCKRYSPESPKSTRPAKQAMYPDVFKMEFENQFKKLETSKNKQIKLAEQMAQLADAQEIQTRRCRKTKTKSICNRTCNKIKYACLECKLKKINEEIEDENINEREIQNELDWFLTNYEPRRPDEESIRSDSDDDGESSNDGESSEKEFSSSDEDMDSMPAEEQMDTDSNQSEDPNVKEEQAEVKQEVESDSEASPQLYADGPRPPLYPNAIVVPLQIQPGLLGMANVIKTEPMDTDDTDDEAMNTSGSSTDSSDEDTQSDIATSDEDMPSDSSDYETSDDDEPMMPEEDEGAEIINHPISKFL